MRSPRGIRSWPSAGWGARGARLVRNGFDWQLMLVRLPFGSLRNGSGLLIFPLLLPFPQGGLNLVNELQVVVKLYRTPPGPVGAILDPRPHLGRLQVRHSQLPHGRHE